MERVFVTRPPHPSPLPAKPGRGDKSRDKATAAAQPPPAIRHHNHLRDERQMKMSGQQLQAESEAQPNRIPPPARLQERLDAPERDRQPSSRHDGPFETSPRRKPAVGEDESHQH